MAQNRPVDEDPEGGLAGNGPDADVASVGSPGGAGQHRVRRRSRLILKRVLLFSITSALALGTAELVARSIHQPEPYITKLLLPDGSYITREAAIASGGLEVLPKEIIPPIVELGFTFAPGAGFLMHYDGLDRPWLDERGCVEVVINGAGVRDSADLGFDKPAGQRRIVCLGDSVTFGWGVPFEMVWTELIEADLRRDMGDVRTVNCGFCGTMMPDEAYYGLMHRFVRFDPDVVVMTICLNDLFECNSGMLHLPPKHSSPSRFWNMLATWWQGGPTALPAGIDHGAELLRAEPSTWRTRYWVGGGTQGALRGVRDWCQERDKPFVVVLWPFFQCLDERYPFKTMHAEVAAFCAEEGIPMLDLFDAFRGQRDVDMWVAPNDAHPSPVAQRIASPVIADFLRKHAL